MNELESIISQMADVCEPLNLPADVVLGNELHQWVQVNVKYRPETEFYLIFLLACELGRRYKTAILAA